MQTASITPSKASGFKPYTVASSSSANANSSKDDKKKDMKKTEKKEEKLKQKAEKAAKKVRRGSFCNRKFFLINFL